MLLHTNTKTFKYIATLLPLLLLSLSAWGQISIGGNVYGGGNAGDMTGSTKVLVRAGNLQGSVYGGARQANVGKNAFVHIDGQHMSGDITINYVYGGNDIAGTIGQADSVPSELTKADSLGIDATYNSFILTTPERKAGEGETQRYIFIGQMFGGSNGAYDYEQVGDEHRMKDKTTGQVVATSTTGFTLPEVAKTYMEVRGGTFGYVYAGGNNATVTQAANICIANTSTPMTANSHLTLPASIDLSNLFGTNGELSKPDNQRLMDMGINLTTWKIGYNFCRVFGGNNQASMHIMPTWHLDQGKIDNLYSGGNEGNMTAEHGLLLEIKATSQIEVDRIFGGCRKADVDPQDDNGDPTEQVTSPPGYKFPAELSARVLVRGGKVKDVYGGNDITGHVRGGTAIGIYTTISGDVYGGGNGSYAYTDNPLFKDDILWGDFYYDPTEGGASSSVEALNAHRPNAEQTSIRVYGQVDNPTIIHGSLYLGGNSASLLKTSKPNPMVELKIGSHCIIDNVFLGNNGVNMVDATVGGILWQYAQDDMHYQTGSAESTATTSFSSLDLTNADTFAEYMKGCAMTIIPNVVFDSEELHDDPDTYLDHTCFIGSFYCGGNVGSMILDGQERINFNHKLVIYDKFVGGCNNANVPARAGFNAAYNGGMLGAPDATTGNKVMFDLEGLKIEPKRWIVERDANYDKVLDGEGNAIYAGVNETQLEWNTVSASTGKDVPPVVSGASQASPVISTAADADRRLKGGHVYGGCYQSGHVNGNVVININAALTDRTEVFDVVKYENGEPKYYHEIEDLTSYKITKRNSGVLLSSQGMDVLGSALNVFGGGYGVDSEIWGSTTINLNKGYVFQIFGGGEMGAVGKRNETTGEYAYDPAYSTTINLKGTIPGVARYAAGDNADMAEAEFIYGGGFLGLVAGNTRINLGNGRVFNTFGGACNADILGHTETYVGLNTSSDVDLGFPWLRDHIYGGNDLGGRISGTANFKNRITAEAKTRVLGFAGTPTATPSNSDVPMNASAYIEYLQGHIDDIYGGCYGYYDYADPLYNDYFYTTGGTGTTAENIGTAREGYTKPRMHRAFVNFRPVAHEKNAVMEVFGAGLGYRNDSDRDIMQESSYVLIDIPQTQTKFQSLDVYGGGAYSGLGMSKTYAATTASSFDATEVSSVIDLVRGEIRAVYGGSLSEGIVRRSVVNVPATSTIKLQNIFGGGFGSNRYNVCDVYESNVNYRSDNATLTGAIYGGNNSERRTLYAKVNIYSPVWSNKASGYSGSVYGAGYGANTWATYTEVNLHNGAKVYEVYGGGQAGKVLNAETEQKFMNTHKPDVWPAGTELAGQTFTTKHWAEAWKLGTGYDPANIDFSSEISTYATNAATNLSNPLARTAEMDDRAVKNYKYNTNVIINEGAEVAGYAYGGGLGADAVVSGTTYIAMLGGNVTKDVYAAGTSGAVEDEFDAGNFTASANAYIRGGKVRNVYGGGWMGNVGHHAGEIYDSTEDDILGEAHVVIGDVNGTSLTDGQPAILRSVYGGGEGGSVFGTAYVTMNNGHIGYDYNTTDGYVEQLDDVTPGDKQLDTAGNIFGGGYVANSFTDASDIKMYGGIVRGSIYGGGEIGPIGRGTIRAGADETNAIRIHEYKEGEKCVIWKGGSTKITMYNGHVLRDIFGGGRGVDNWGGDGTKYMDPDVKAALDLSIKGFIFGSTDVRIRGGEVGLRDNVATIKGGHGNVFGGSDVGFVFSAEGKKKGERKSQALSELENGLPKDGGGYYYKKWLGDEGVSSLIDCELSLDCNVVVEPYCKVTDAGGITIDGNSYAQGEYVPIEDLNKLRDKNQDAAQWAKIDWESGVTIHNAVFAGGNVTVGSDQLYVNTGTVFGNVAAALRDVYHRDLISIGTEHVGGLYGDGNLTFVDGWRELHIDNYGTDYYNMSSEIQKDEYLSLSDRERAYFVLNYRCITACRGKTGDIHVGDRLNADQFKEAFDFDNYHEPTYPADYKNYINEDGTANPAYFEELGFCSIYAGRLLNTIQRCDMAAVFGSRIVLQGARDRVPEKADYTSYTINRVGELSLNQRKTVAQGDAEDNLKHGNYFGIYNIVNYLGNLTSDVFFTKDQAELQDPDAVSKRSTTSTTEANRQSTTYEGVTTPYGQTTYFQWKAARPNASNRNNGSSPNKVSLSSGVYLEIVREESERLGTKEWGLITGVVELDLIDVKTGLGGGYVYARNQHGYKTWHKDWQKVNLSPYNETAHTYKRFTYDESDAVANAIETSGNFVHNTKQIVDDCWPESNAYHSTNKAPAHYWFIKGSIYVYDQYISAYTGAPTAYHQMVNIPITIQAATHGKMTMRDVQENRYAYYDDNGQPLGNGSVIVGDETYHAGDPIDYWKYQSMNTAEQAHFVDSIYNVIGNCKVGDTEYAEGTVLLPGNPDGSDEGTYWGLRKAGATVTFVEDGVEKTDPDKGFDYFFRPANIISHNEGFVLTVDMSNPGVWDMYYTSKDGTLPKLTKEQYLELSNTDKEKYIAGPTYTTTHAGVYGQKHYLQGSLIAKDIFENQAAIASFLNAEQQGLQAEAERAYVVTQNFALEGQQLQVGAPVYRSNYTAEQWSAISEKIAPAMLCVSTLKYSDEGYIYAGDLLTDAEITALGLTPDQKHDHLSEAYIITREGLYGGSNFASGQAYSALKSWSSMSKEDRANFRFNYDAFNVLADPTFGGSYGFKPQYDGYMPGTRQWAIDNGTATAQFAGCTPLNPNVYSPTQYLDFEAEFNPSSEQITALGNHYDTENNCLTYTDENGQTVSIPAGYANRISRTEFDDIPNERAHWSPIIVTEAGPYYVVKTPFIRGDVPYTVGQVIDGSIYNALSTQQATCIETITFADQHKNKTYYFCREPYVIGELGEGTPITNLGITDTQTTMGIGDSVKTHLLIDETTYNSIPNLQTGFNIHGTSPLVSTTFYVSRDPNIHDLQKEKIYTIIYLYEYEESDESGHNMTPVSERHILNIHITFESGVPEIGPLSSPDIVLPGTTVGLKIPSVEPGAFEITSSGWEIFHDEEDALYHRNGQAYTNNETPMYWYQDGYYVAYYTKTYLGKTYSNAVPFKVANYHDLKKVMGDKEHHYYIDHEDATKEREPKIYINDYSATSENGLDLFKQFYDLSVLTGPVVAEENLDANGLIASGDFMGHAPLNARVAGGAGLEFIMRTDLDHSEAPWQSIGQTQCFEGNFHGDGYTISGLDHSLFNKLCGNVYNLGVTGSFTEAGIANEGSGFVENCWVKTTGDPSTASPVPAAVFGNPTRGNGIQLVNCYYPESNAYNEAVNARGNAIKMDDAAFYNGTVAYNLNGYYLSKRYYDHTTISTSTPTTPYTYLKANADGTLSQETASYPKDYAYYYDPQDNKCGYVESRYAYPDFVYAGGSIPETPDVRLLADGVSYAPIWPDDYLFFGQMLTYGYNALRPHQPLPARNIKDGGRLPSADESNRVYRAPAYFRSKTMGVAHFNPWADLAALSADGTTEAYPGMTAIDFTGYGDSFNSNTGNPLPYQQGFVKTAPYHTDHFGGTGAFFPPLLDNDGLTGIANHDLTHNLLVYIAGNGVDPTSADGMTRQVVTDYASDPDYTAYYDDLDTYRRVLDNKTYVNIHAVERATGGSLLGSTNYKSTYDHFLVDKQDFNAPIAYTFAADKRMWYQRKPDLYADMKKGWEGISLPFEAELVSTDQKGEITHFYEGETTGHEYWLREYRDIQLETDEQEKAKAIFTYPNLRTGGEDKIYGNTFLWDYYYKDSEQQDKNTDIYKQYYNTSHEYDDYPYLEQGKPYIIGFPSKRYYEFDLSGQFLPEHTFSAYLTPLNRQTITFASDTGITIGVSDDELAAGIVSHNGYDFRPNYLQQSLPAGTEGYTLNATGNAYALLPATGANTQVLPFRPYFAATPTAGTRGIRLIEFSEDTCSPRPEMKPTDTTTEGGLTIRSKKLAIEVSSTCSQPVDVRIYTVGGLLVTSYEIEPGETVKTDVPMQGVYVVNQKKIIVK